MSNVDKLRNVPLHLVNIVLVRYYSLRSGGVFLPSDPILITFRNEINGSDTIEDVKEKIADEIEEAGFSPENYVPGVWQSLELRDVGVSLAPQLKENMPLVDQVTHIKEPLLKGVDTGMRLRSGRGTGPGLTLFLSINWGATDGTVAPVLKWLQNKIPTIQFVALIGTFEDESKKWPPPPPWVLALPEAPTTPLPPVDEYPSDTDEDTGGVGGYHGWEADADAGAAAAAAYDAWNPSDTDEDTDGSEEVDTPMIIVQDADGAFHMHPTGSILPPGYTIVDPEPIMVGAPQQQQGGRRRKRRKHKRKKRKTRRRHKRKKRKTRRRKKTTN